MQIFDISMQVFEGMAVYKNREEKQPVIRNMRNFSNSSIYESRIDMDVHCGTHLDMPLHTVEGGSTIDSLDLHKVITSCRVLDLTNLTGEIRDDDLALKEIAKEDFILLKTRNSFSSELDFNFVYLHKTGASYLRDKGIKGVGIDALGIERDQPGHDTHNILLGSGILILEGLRLAMIEEGQYFLYAAPVSIRGIEAAPVRAVLMKE